MALDLVTFARPVTKYARAIHAGSPPPLMLAHVLAANPLLIMRAIALVRSPRGEPRLPGRDQNCLAHRNLPH
jgi:hypothetical protein